jgi:protein HIRA/HIR1
VRRPADAEPLPPYDLPSNTADSRVTDGYVRIWSTEAILNSNNPDYTKPRQLAAISHHSGTIHAVRFSPNGKYLASGADDKIVCVYALDPNAPTHVSTFGRLLDGQFRAGLIEHRLKRTAACRELESSSASNRA